MKRKIGLTLLMALISFSALAAADSGAAKEPRLGGPTARFAQADTNGDGLLSKAEVQAALPRLADDFDKIDANHDGQLSRDELYGFMRAHFPRRHGMRHHFQQCFAQADKNGDGQLSLEEARAGMPRLADDFAKLDLNHDGQLSRDELRQAMRERFRHGPGHEHKPFLAKLDTNNDGKLSMDEAKAAFERADANKDGFVTGDELRAAAGPRGCGH
ncbi:EF-hand domain-containing protein [Pseudogulbenkiania sp. MAI-1]|uniref:EF-hand domain-containing protein n=1 Tax=Pseudogulbenkiania sp. MAI-1 TaxID=990370 RepID=UPI00045E6936|nr:EF-hand domain-containing protein [Pseudogulbenkiania sp. MAI-1]